MTDPESLRLEACKNCGQKMDTRPGYDHYIEVTEYTTTDWSSEVYCSRECLAEAIQDND